jgi:predicted amidophosphoribosyltransferase
MSIYVIDDFTDGDYTASPPWTVTLGTWSAASQYLALTGSGSGVIATSHTGAIGEWSFKFNFPSGGDGVDARVRFYLMSSAQDTQNTNGYYVFATTTTASTNSFSLVRQDGTLTPAQWDTTAFNRGSGWHTVRVTRTSAGAWTVYFDGTQVISATDNTYTASNFVGMRNLNSDGAHQVQVDDIVFTPPVNPPAVTVNAPNGGESWIGGSTQTISWSAAQGDFPLKANSATLYYSTTGCGGAWTQIVAGQPTTGTYSWTVPNSPGSQACVRVTVEDNQSPANLGADTSNAVFTISPGNSPPAVALVSPAPGGAVSGIAKIEWDGSDPDSNTVQYSVRLSQDSGGTWNQIATAAFAEGPVPTRRSVPFDTTTFSDKTTYRLRIEANDGNGSAANATGAGDFTIDNTDPACSMTPLPSFVTTAQFPLSWNGSDSTSGIAGYDIMVSESGQPKYGWKWNATNTSDSFSGTDGVTYAFYCEPWDRAGNHQTKANPDTSTVVDATGPSSRVSMMPRAVPSTTFDVPFTVVDATATETTVHWRLLPSGPWTPSTAVPLPKGTTSGSARVTVQSEGKYEFYALAKDAAGHQEAKAAIAEADTIVDTLPPSITASVLDSLVAGIRVRVDIDAQDNLELDHVLVEFMPADGSAQWKAVRNFSSILKPTFQTTTDVTLTGAADGPQLVRFVAVDSAGQRALSAESKVTVDQTRPTIVSTSPATGAADVPIEGPFKLGFSEPMNKSSVENAIKITGGPSTARVGAVSWSGDEALVDLAGLEGNATYTLTVATDAMDVAGNKLEKSAEVKFTTVPTHGGLTGTVREPSGAAVKGAALRLTQGNESVTRNVSKEGTFSVEALRAGTWTIHAEARGYIPLDATVTVVAGRSTHADLTMEKDILPTMIGSLVGAVALLVVLFLLVRLLAKKCRVCKNRLPRNANACPVCGNVVKQKSKLDLQREAREAREADFLAQQRATAAAAPKQPKKKAKGAAPAPAAGPTGPPMLAVSKPRPTNCFACGEALKADDEWCGKCGQAVGAAESVEACRSCGGSVLDGVCINCGAAVPEVDESRPPEGRPCPRCMSPLPEGSGFCDQCGFDVSSRPAPPAPAPASKPSVPGGPQETPATAAGPPRAPAPAPLSVPPMEARPPPPSRPPVGTLPGPSPGSAASATCRTCSSPVTPDMVICDVCGEPLRK